MKVSYSLVAVGSIGIEILLAKLKGPIAPTPNFGPATVKPEFSVSSVIMSKFVKIW